MQLRFLTGVAMSLLVVGCAPSPGATGGKTSARVITQPSVPPTVKILSWDQTQKELAQHRGKVVILDFWSTYCDPCIREFPNLVELQSRFPGQVVCLSFNTDYTGAKDESPESLRGRVLKFLESQKAQIVNVICSDPSDDFFTKIHLGGPPAVFVYDRGGKLVKRFDNSKVPKVPEFTYKNDVVPLVEKLLSGSN